MKKECLSIFQSSWNLKRYFSFLVIVLFVYLSVWINVEAWNVLRKTFTSEITGLVTKRVVLVPFLLVVIILFFTFLIYRYNKSVKRLRVIFGLIFLLALTLRLTWISLIPTIPETDFKYYHEMAIRLATNETGIFGKPLGYPLLLSLTYRIFPDAISGRILNVILGLITVLSVYGAGKILSDSNGGLFSMLWMALSPSEIFMTSVLGTEVALSTFVTGAIFLMVLLINKNKEKFKNYFYIPGFILGIAATIRPTSVLVFVLLVILPLLHRGIKNKLVISTKVFIGLLLVPAALIIWTSIASHHFTLRSLFYGNYPLLSGTNISQKGFYNIEDVKLYYSIPEENRNKKVVEIAFSRLTKEDFLIVFNFISDKILYYMTNNLYGSLWPFYTVDLPISENQLIWVKKWIDVLAQSWYFLALLGTSLLVLYSQIKNDRLWLLFFGIIFLSVLPHAIYEVQARYHHVLLPFLSLGCGLITIKMVLPRKHVDCEQLIDGSGKES